MPYPNSRGSDCSPPAPNYCRGPSTDPCGINDDGPTANASLANWSNGADWRVSRMSASPARTSVRMLRAGEPMPRREESPPPALSPGNCKREGNKTGGHPMLR